MAAQRLWGYSKQQAVLCTATQCFFGCSYTGTSYYTYKATGTCAACIDGGGSGSMTHYVQIHTTGKYRVVVRSQPSSGSTARAAGVRWLTTDMHPRFTPT